MSNTWFLGYLLIGFIFLYLCLIAFFQDHYTPKTDRVSWLAILLIPSFWPLALCLSLLELAYKYKLLRMIKIHAMRILK